MIFLRASLLPVGLVLAFKMKMKWKEENLFRILRGLG
jgi:hypothetical protein